MDYFGSNNRTSQQKFIVRFGKGLVWWLIGAIVCWLYSFFMYGLMTKFMVMKLFSGICALLIVDGFYCNFAYNCATDDRNLNKVRHIDVDPKTAIKLAICTPILQYVTWILLLLSKIGVIGDIFSYYLFANMYTVGWVKLFTDETTVSAVSVGGLIGLLILALSSSVTIYITYMATFNEIDVKKLVVYKRK